MNRSNNYSVNGLTNDILYEMQPECIPLDISIPENALFCRNVNRNVDSYVKQAVMNISQDFFNAQEEIVIEEVIDQEILIPEITGSIRNVSGSDHNNLNSGAVEFNNSGICAACGEYFEDSLDLQLHNENHKHQLPFTSICTMCDSVFHNKTLLRDHVKQFHNDAKIIKNSTCHTCGEHYGNARELQKHTLVHIHSELFPCSLCDKTFYSRAKLKKHIVSHQDITNADKCVQNEDTKTKKKPKYFIIKNGTRVFPCYMCDKMFGTRSSQQIHFRVHTGERPYGCRYCLKAFADGGTLRKHERIHTGEKPYVCPICFKAFNQRVVLREHIRSHHVNNSPKSYEKCDVCGITGLSSNELFLHLIKHSDENTAKRRLSMKPPKSRKKNARKNKQKHNIVRRRKSTTTEHCHLVYEDELDLDLDYENETNPVYYDSTMAVDLQIDDDGQDADDDKNLFGIYSTNNVYADDVVPKKILSVNDNDKITSRKQYRVNNKISKNNNVKNDRVINCSEDNSIKYVIDDDNNIVNTNYYDDVEVDSNNGIVDCDETNFVVIQENDYNNIIRCRKKNITNDSYNYGRTTNNNNNNNSFNNRYNNCKRSTINIKKNELSSSDISFSKFKDDDDKLNSYSKWELDNEVLTYDNSDRSISEISSCSSISSGSRNSSNSNGDSSDSSSVSNDRISSNNKGSKNNCNNENKKSESFINTVFDLDIDYRKLIKTKMEDESFDDVSCTTNIRASVDINENADNRSISSNEDSDNSNKNYNKNEIKYINDENINFIKNSIKDDDVINYNITATSNMTYNCHVNGILIDDLNTDNNSVDFGLSLGAMVELKNDDVAI